MSSVLPVSCCIWINQESQPWSSDFQVLFLQVVGEFMMSGCSKLILDKFGIARTDQANQNIQPTSSIKVTFGRVSMLRTATELRIQNCKVQSDRHACHGCKRNGQGHSWCKLGLLFLTFFLTFQHSSRDVAPGWLSCSYMVLVILV